MNYMYEQVGLAPISLPVTKQSVASLAIHVIAHSIFSTYFAVIITG